MGGGGVIRKTETIMNCYKMETNTVLLETSGLHPNHGSMSLKQVFGMLVVAGALVLAHGSARAQEGAGAGGYPENRLGLLRPSSKLMNTPVWDREQHQLGRIKDLVVDLSSGRVLCALVAPANLFGPTNYFVAVPAKCFTLADR